MNSCFRHASRAFRTLARLAPLPLFFAGSLGAGVAPDPAADRELLQRVVQAVLSQTTRRLVDRGTGELFTDSSRLPLKAEISIESKFNAWYYQTWLLTDGMHRTGAVLGDLAGRDYGEQNLEFLYSHLPYFERQHVAGLRAAPVGDGKLSPIGFYFNLVDTYLAQATTTPEGAIYRPNGRLMADDPYMLVPYLVRLARATGEARPLERAIQQVLGARHLLFEPAAGLYWHAWHVAQAKPLGLRWGRANGWMVLTQVELLAALPPDHPRFTEVRTAFVEHAAGLRRVQDPAAAGIRCWTIRSRGSRPRAPACSSTASRAA